MDPLRWAGLLERCVLPEPVKDADPACAALVLHVVRHILRAFRVSDVRADDVCPKVFRAAFLLYFCSGKVSEV